MQRPLAFLVERVRVPRDCDPTVCETPVFAALTAVRGREAMGQELEPRAEVGVWQGISSLVTSLEDSVTAFVRLALEMRKVMECDDSPPAAVAVVAVEGGDDLESLVREVALVWV